MTNTLMISFTQRSKHICEEPFVKLEPQKVPISPDSYFTLSLVLDLEGNTANVKVESHNVKDTFILTKANIYEIHKLLGSLYSKAAQITDVLNSIDFMWKELCKEAASNNIKNIEASPIDSDRELIDGYVKYKIEFTFNDNEKLLFYDCMTAYDLIALFKDFMGTDPNIKETN